MTRKSKSQSDKPVRHGQSNKSSDANRQLYERKNETSTDVISTGLEEDSRLLYVVKMEVEDVCIDYDIDVRDAHFFYIAHALRRAGATPDDIAATVAEFVTTDAFAHCLKYKHPPAPSDVVDAYERIVGETAVERSEKEYQDYLKRRQKKWIANDRDTDDDGGK